MPSLPVVAQTPKRGRKQSKITNFFSKAQTATVSRIAKRVVNRQAETKSPIYLSQQTFVDDLVYVINPLHNIAQGDALENRDGHKIHLKNFYIKGKFTAVNSATVGNGTTLMRFMIIKTPQQLATTNAGTTLGATSAVFRGSLVNFASRGFPDLSKVNVVYDKTWTMKTDQKDTNQHIAFVINKKIGKTFQYALNAASYAKEDNYYFVMTASKTDGTVGNCLLTDFQYAVNFKDI